MAKRSGYSGSPAEFPFIVQFEQVINKIVITNRTIYFFTDICSKETANFS